MNTPPKPTTEQQAEQQAEHIADLCRELYKTNEGPRLLALVIKDFPNPRGPISKSSGPMTHNLG